MAWWKKEKNCAWHYATYPNWRELEPVIREKDETYEKKRVMECEKAKCAKENERWACDDLQSIHDQIQNLSTNSQKSWKITNSKR